MAIPEYPISRIEHYLARANGQNVTPPDPISRIEHYLAGIAGGVPQELLDDVAELKSQISEKAHAIMQTVNNQAIASFADGADDMPLKSLTVAINPVQAGTGDPSPENVRPITWWTGCKVTRTGKNLFDKSLADVGFIESSTGNVIANVSYLHSDYIMITPGATYCSTDTGFSGNNYGAYYDINKKYITGVSISSFPGTFTAPANACYIRVSIDPLKIDTVQIEIGSTATAYEPYRGNTYDVSWETEAGTVYGGTLDVVSGELTVTRANVDLGTLDYIYQAIDSGVRAYTYGLANLIKKPFAGLNLVSSRFIPTTSLAEVYTSDNLMWLSDAGNVSFSARLYESDAAFKTAMNGVQLVYELAEPQTVQLTPVEVKTLLGQNNIFADTGNVSVEYPADTKMYIDGKISELQALVLENISNS